MSKLLSAGFRRWFSHKLYWGALVVSVLFGLNTYELDIDVVPWEFIFIGAMIAFFVGIENQEGGFRNKILAGYSRKKVFMSEMIVALCASYVLIIAYIITTVISEPHIVHLIPIIEAIKGVIMFLIIDSSIVIISVFISVCAFHKWFSMILLIITVFALTFIGFYADYNETNYETDISSVIADIIPMNTMEETCYMYDDYYDSWKYAVYRYGIKIGVYEKEGLTKEDNREYCENILGSIVFISTLTLAGLQIISKKDFK